MGLGRKIRVGNGRIRIQQGRISLKTPVTKKFHKMPFEVIKRSILGIPVPSIFALGRILFYYLGYKRINK